MWQVTPGAELRPPPALHNIRMTPGTYMSEYENMTKTIVPSKLLYRFGGTLLWHAQLGSDFAVMVTKGSLVGVLVVQLRRTGVC